MRKKFVVIGNWKMHKTIGEAKNFVESLAPYLKKNLLEVGLAIPFTSLFALSSYVKQQRLSLCIGAQNMHEMASGAFTGEISSSMLNEAGAQFVILGHSERRHIFHESEERINLKIRKALEEPLDVILCVGEKWEEREKKATKDIIRRQLHSALQGVKNLNRITLAYEPVWAIGTGKVAKPEDAQEVHAFCRKEIENLYGKENSEKIVIQYGGSVQQENAEILSEQPDIDGLLVGGASLKVDSFIGIIEKVASKSSKELH